MTTDMAILAQAPGISGASLLAIFFAAAVTDNILLTRFLGMCSYLAISRELKSAVGLGAAVTFVTGATCMLNAALYWYVLVPLGLEVGLQLILFIIVIAAFVQLLEMVVERISLTLYFSLGVYLPLITVNCAILGASLFMINKDYRVVEGLVYGLGAGLGWMLAIVLLAGIRWRLRKARIPVGLEGPGITLIITGIMALAFLAFSGLVKV
jgi:Na+-transporting NADH:ubiquinone oxidoreductase subunit E